MTQFSAQVQNNLSSRQQADITEDSKEELLSDSGQGLGKVRCYGQQHN